jgi:hypothetical protein
MSEKKNIENLFREKFNDFEVVPDEQIWNNIESQLKEKREKRRIIPFWWKLSGIAASLVLGFLITDNLFLSEPTLRIDQNKVANQDKNTVIEKSSNGSASENEIKQIKTAVKVTEASSGKGNKVEKILSNENYVVSEKNSGNGSEGLVYAIEKKTRRNSLTSLKKHTLSKSGIKTNAAFTDVNEQIANVDSREKETIANENTAMLNNKEKPLSKNANSAIATAFDSNLSNTKNTENLIIAENNTEAIKNSDTTKIALVSNALEELLNEKETKKKAGPKLNRWQIATNVAPIYFSSTSGGSPLDSRFESNDKDFEPSYSYGLGINYALNKKWSIKTGVNSLAYEYNTNGVVIYQNVNAREMQHVNSNLQGSLLQVENKSNSDTQEVTLNAGIVEKFDGSINQKMGYIEIPVEIGYKIIDKKFGVEVITGISSLLLNENSVSVVSSGQSITIGEANNLNDFHFSGNLGIGFRYLFWKSFNANVNPMFKYQINTFNTDSGNFKPYIFGLYTGISYTF